jgi:hypothetical protein
MAVLAVMRLERRLGEKLVLKRKFEAERSGRKRAVEFNGVEESLAGQNDRQLTSSTKRADGLVVEKRQPHHRRVLALDRATDVP